MIFGDTSLLQDFSNARYKTRIQKRVEAKFCIKKYQYFNIIKALFLRVLFLNFFIFTNVIFACSKKLRQ